MEETIKTLIDFHRRAERLKATTRHSWLSDPTRQESVAEHTWMLCLLAMLMADKLDRKVDLLKVMKILVVHDLPESVTGDIPAYEVSVRRQNKEENEKIALLGIVDGLPESEAGEIVSLWQEYADNKTPEANFAVALDKAEAVMQHNIADISTWDQGDFDVHPYYKDHHFDFDSFIRAFKDVLDSQSMIKIIEAGAEGRTDPKHLERYKAETPVYGETK